MGAPVVCAAAAGPSARPGRGRRARATGKAAIRIRTPGPAPSRMAPRRSGRDLSLNEAADTCRADVWLWRARFFKTRSLAARVIEQGGIRLARGGARAPLDKPSRSLCCGDILTFAQGSRWLAVRIEALGVRRGPAPEARTLYRVMGEPGDGTGAEPGT